MRTVVRSLALAVVAVVGLTACSTSPTSAISDPARPVVTTDLGQLRGVLDGNHVSYQGVPYAAPPVGALRWQDPAPAKPWPGVRDADKPGAQCPQTTVDTPPKVVGDEDCLFLNVTAPSKPGADRPVMVWLHGGFGQGSGDTYGAARFAVRGDVVVVTLNYRLGVLSYLAHPDLPGGDFGYADQRAALTWLRHNAQAFGGDPHDITLFGESSGGLSTCAQLASPAAKGLFDKAIMQSGTCLLTIPRNGVAPGADVYDQWQPRSAMAGLGTQFATTEGCTVPTTAIGCLRAKPVAELISSPLAGTFGLASYGIPSLPDRPADVLNQGRLPAVPLMMGATHDEMGYFVALSLTTGQKIDAAGYDKLLTDTFGKAADRVRQTYPAAKFSSPAKAWATALTDASFSCTTWKAASVTSAKTPTYAYEFDDPTGPLPPGAVSAPGFTAGAAHGFELPYLWDFPGSTLTPAQHATGERMIDYWSQFARTGDPGAGWPRYTAAKPDVLSLAPGQFQVTDKTGAAHHCDLWDSVTR